MPLHQDNTAASSPGIVASLKVSTVYHGVKVERKLAMCCAQLRDTGGSRRADAAVQRARRFFFRDTVRGIIGVLCETLRASLTSVGLYSVCLSVCTHYGVTFILFVREKLLRAPGCLVCACACRSVRVRLT